MIHKYIGEEELQDFHDAIGKQMEAGVTTMSPGGAASFFRVSRQRIHQILNEREDVRAWAYYEVRGRLFRAPEVVLAYMYISIDDLFVYGFNIGKFRNIDEMGMLPFGFDMLIERVKDRIDDKKALDNVKSDLLDYINRD